MVSNRNESAVSEVISVVLVVALTVILAALVAAYMFGMVPTIPTPRTVALTADQPDDHTITIIYHGGPDASSLQSMNITWPSGAQQQVISPKIGTVYTAVNIGSGLNATAGKDHIIVAGTFPNNVQQVILETYV